MAKQALKPDVFMIFYVGDYIASTTHMSTLEHGAYLLILFHYWRTGTPPPDDDSRLARIARLSVTEWDTVRDTVRSWFHSVNLNGEWVLVNSKLERTMMDAHAGLSKKREASKAGNAAKAAKRAAEVRVAAAVAHRLGTEPVSQPAPNRIPDGNASGPDPASQTAPESEAEAESDIEKKEESLRDSCAKPAIAVSAPQPELPAFLDRREPKIPAIADPIWIEIPTASWETKQETFPVTEAKIAQWEGSYPGVDVRQQLKNMRQWSFDNRAKRKTKNGMLKFINGWLAREQDKPKGDRNHGESFGAAKNRRFLGGLARAAANFGDAQD